MKKKNIIFYFVIFFVFLFLALFIGIKHEPWADEAHAWLIARDTSIITLFSTYLHTDGHPALWHILLKLLQFFHFPYRFLFLVPIFFTSIGVLLFLFKSKFPWYIKLFVPFSYFIFYQYTIVARGYCLIFPLLCCLAILWEKRKEKCFLFSIVLFLLINLEAYTYFFALAVYLFCLYEDRNTKEKKKSYLFSSIFLGCSFFLTFLYVCPIPSNTFSAVGPGYFPSDSFITPFYFPTVIKIIVTFLFIFLFYYCYKKSTDFNNIKQFVFFLLPVILFFHIKYYNLWHLGIILLLTIFCFWIHHMDKNKFSCIFLLLILLVQTYFSITSSFYDYKNTYSPAFQVATFLKQYKNCNIYGLTFNEGAINPYFKHNIYQNWNKNLGFFYWNTKSKFYQQKIDEKYMLKHNLEIVVTSKFYTTLDYNQLKEKYNQYVFHGYSYFENKKFEDQTQIVYVLKKIDKKTKDIKY